MDKASVITEIISYFSFVFKDVEITSGTKLIGDLHAKSLQLIGIINNIYKKTHVNIPLAIMMKCETIEEIADYVMEKM